MAIYQQELFNAQSANGNSTGYAYKGSGTAQFKVAGTFDGATVKLQAYDNKAAEWVDVPGSSFTSAGSVKINFSYGEQFRANASSVGTSSLYASVIDFGRGS